MEITIKAFNRSKYFDIAIDEVTGICLVGIPFSYGPAEHVNYYVISKEEFESGVKNPDDLSHLVDEQTFHGAGEFYYSTFAGVR